MSSLKMGNQAVFVVDIKGIKFHAGLFREEVLEIMKNIWCYKHASRNCTIFQVGNCVTLIYLSKFMEHVCVSIIQVLLNKARRPWLFDCP